MTCPELEQLERYASDDLSEADASSAAEHLSACADCRAHLEDIRANLEIVGPVKAALSGREDGQSSGSVLDLGAPPSNVGQFAIEREIGRGGMGVVYLARQERPRREVALKLMHPLAASETALRRFEREADILGLLQHPGIAPVHEAGIAELPGPDGSPVRLPYIAMEYVRGQRLEAFIRDRQPDLRTRLALLIRIARAVHHAHGKGVIHRDLKPGNVLVVTGEDGEPLPKILDFGVARLSQPDQVGHTLATSPGQILGTVPFMSPEQIAGDPADVDARSDVYALGVLGFWMLSGRLPHDVARRSLVDAARVIRDEDPLHLSTIRADLRGDVETIIATALEKDVERRYSSAAALADDLERHRRDEPILARPASTMYQLGKFARRHRGLVASLAVIMVVLVAATIISSTQAVRATRNERQAQREAEKFGRINAFLEDILSSIDPMLSPESRDITMREVIDNAMSRLDDGSLADDPEVEIPVRLTIGETYKSLGEYVEAEKHFRRVVALLEADEETDGIELAEALNKLARAREEQGADEDAEEIYSRAMELTLAAVGDAHPMTAKLLNNLGLLHHRMGDSETGEAELRRSIALGESGVSEPVDLATSLNNLGIVRRAQGDLAEAETLFRRSLEIDRDHRGDLHPNIATTLSNLALLRRDLGNIDEAEANLREVLDLRLRTVGKEHPYYVVGLSNLAVILRAKGELDEAEARFREAIEIDAAMRGPGHPAVLTMVYNLGRVLVDQGRLNDAETLFREAVTTVRGAEPSDPRLLGAFLHRQGECLLNLGRNDEAQTVLSEAHAELTAAFGADHASTKAVEALMAEIVRAGEAPGD